MLETCPDLPVTIITPHVHKPSESTTNKHCVIQLEYDKKTTGQVEILVLFEELFVEVG